MEGLSAGQTTRVMLAKAFLARPRVALLDEPTASLDPDIAHEVREFVCEQRDHEGVSIVYTSHNMDEVAQICDRVIFLDRGRIAAVGGRRSWRPRRPRRGCGSASREGSMTCCATRPSAGLATQVDDGMVEVEIDEHADRRVPRGPRRPDVRYTEISIASRPSRTISSSWPPGARDGAERTAANGGTPSGHERACDDAGGDSPMRLHRIVAMIMRHLYLFPRTLERWSESIYWPVIDLILWGLTSRWVESAGTEVPQLALIVLTGVVFWQVVWRANYEISVNLLEEFWNQNMVNLFATPLSVWEWSVGLVVLGLLKNLLTLVVGAGAVWLLYRLNIFAVGWMILPFLFSLLISGWFMGFAASGRDHLLRPPAPEPGLDGRLRPGPLQRGVLPRRGPAGLGPDRSPPPCR